MMTKRKTKAEKPGKYSIGRNSGKNLQILGEITPGADPEHHFEREKFENF